MRVSTAAVWVAALAVCVASIWPGAARAQRALELSSVQEPRAIGPTALEYRDASRTMTAAEVAALPIDRFTPLHAERPSWGFTSSAIWVRFALSNDGATPAVYALDATREWVERVSLFEITEEGAPRLIAASGADVPLAERPLPSTRIVFPIELHPGQSRSYLLRLASRSPLALDGVLRSRAAHATFELREQVSFGAYYAILLGLALSSLGLFMAFRERRQLLVCLVLASYALAEAAAHGHVAALLPDIVDLPELRVSAFMFGSFLASLTTATLDAASVRAPRRSVRWVPALIASLTLPAVVWPEAYVLVFVALALAVPVNLLLAMRGVRAGVRDARYYLAGVFVMLVPGAFSIAALFGVLSTDALMEQANHVGAVLMSILFSLLVVDGMRRDRSRIGALTRSTEALNVELKSRLEQVESAMETATKANEELRFQVAARSRALVGVLAQHSGEVSGAVPTVGEVVDGRYRVEGVLGAGGWGLVYEVQRLSDGGRFALKILSRAKSGRQAARLAREAEIGARMRHDNLVSIVDVGVLSGATPYIVMEMVEGGSLEGQRERFGDVAWVLPILLGAARGLVALHSERIVHRDIKPGNVLLDLSAGGVVARVADFGIARPEEHHAVDPLDVTMESSALNGSPKLTGVDGLLGTPLYMPPEAAHGASVGPEGDVFAFGVMAYEALGGTTPYAQPAVFAVHGNAPLGEPAHLAATSPLLTEELRECLRAAVLADPGARPTMERVARALEVASAPILSPALTSSALRVARGSGVEGETLEG